jgi:hypothetical protein
MYDILFHLVAVGYFRMLQLNYKIHGVTSQKSVTSGHHPEHPKCHREDLEDSSSLGFNAVSMG